MSDIEKKEQALREAVGEEKYAEWQGLYDEQYAELLDIRARMEEAETRLWRLEHS